MRLDISKPKSVWTALSALMLSAFAYVPLAAAVQQSTPLPSDTASALVIEPERTLRFTTDEGTWVSLDVSPDGERIAFDLQSGFFGCSK